MACLYACTLLVYMHAYGLIFGMHPARFYAFTRVCVCVCVCVCGILCMCVAGLYARTQLDSIHAHSKFTYSHRTHIYMYLYMHICTLQVRQIVATKTSDFHNKLHNLNPQYMRLVSMVGPDIFTQIQHVWHMRGLPLDLLHAACLSATSASAVRWSSLQGIKIRDVYIKPLTIGQARVHTVHVHITTCKTGTDSIRLTGFVRHQRVIKCPVFNTALLFWHR